MADPATYRSTAGKLAQLTGGRVINVRYRLSPQNAFPEALLDVFLVYLSLLHPPPGSFHEPVCASDIVIAGDSAGGNLSMCLLQLLLQLHRRSGGVVPRVRFHGKDVQVRLPGGVAVNSPWMDVTHCMPSMETNANLDFLPPPSFSDNTPFPADSIWPTNPPRQNIFCNGSAVCHPLVSPMAALDWRGAPPVFIVCGEELLTDEDKVMARRLAIQGVKVVWEQYEGMPHVFGVLLSSLDIGMMSLKSWAENIKSFVLHQKDVQTRGIFITGRKLERLEVNVKDLYAMSDEEVVSKMKEMRDKKIKDFDNGILPWKKIRM
jgi:acetyl esterase/lipase